MDVTGGGGRTCSTDVKEDLKPLGAGLDGGSIALGEVIISGAASMRCSFCGRVELGGILLLALAAFLSEAHGEV